MSVTAKDERQQRLAADRERRHALRASQHAGALPEVMADMFTEWANREGILARITGEQCADLALAFGAGFMCGQAVAETPKSAPDPPESGSGAL